MLIIKQQDKNKKDWFTFIIDKNLIKSCKTNENFVKVNLNADFVIGLSNKKSAKISEINFAKLELEAK